MTVTWHVDDLKVSHKEGAELKKFESFLRSQYGEKVVAHYGKVHDYLGIDLDYSQGKGIKVSMIKYLLKILTGFSEKLGASVSDPAADHLFQIREESKAKF